MGRNRQFIVNTFMLTVVTLLLRTVSISFQVYIANRIGALGMGLFSLVMSVYAFGVTFACSGVHLASTKLVAEELATNNEKGVERAVFVSSVYALIFGLFAFLLIFFGADFISNTLLNDARARRPLIILAVSLPCVSVSSALSGYFYSVGRVYKSALVQLLEQFLKVLGAFFLLNIFANKGAEHACIAVVLSGTIAEIFSFLILFTLYRLERHQSNKKERNERMVGRLLHISLPIAVSSYVRSGLSTIEHAMIPKGLKKFDGNTESALSSYGLVHGMVMPIIFFPSFVLDAFSLLLIPEMTKYHKEQNFQKIKRIIEKSLYKTQQYSIGVSMILFAFSKEIAVTLYHNPEISLFIKVLAPLAALMYLDGVVDAMLKGLNQQVHSMGYNIIDSALAILLIFILLPQKGVYGYLLTIYITEIVNAFLSINRLILVADFKIHPVKWTLFPFVSISSCILFIKYVMGLNNLLGLVLSVGLYIVLILLSDGSFNKKTAVAKLRLL